MINKLIGRKSLIKFIIQAVVHLEKNKKVVYLIIKICLFN
jgi:hypothetical protein